MQKENELITKIAAINAAIEAVDSWWDGVTSIGRQKRIEKAIMALPSAQYGEDIRAMCGECDAWNKYKNYSQSERFNPCTVCQEFDCTGCKFKRTKGR